MFKCCCAWYSSYKSSSDTDAFSQHDKECFSIVDESFKNMCEADMIEGKNNRKNCRQIPRVQMAWMITFFHMSVLVTGNFGLSLLPIVCLKQVRGLLRCQWGGKWKWHMIWREVSFWDLVWLQPAVAYGALGNKQEKLLDVPRCVLAATITLLLFFSFCRRRLQRVAFPF